MENLYISVFLAVKFAKFIVFYIQNNSFLYQFLNSFSHLADMFTLTGSNWCTRYMYE